MAENSALREVLLNALTREREKIERAKDEIVKLKEDLREIGWMEAEPSDGSILLS